MEKKIADYIHLYLGCEFQRFAPSGLQHDSRKLTGSVIHEINSGMYPCTVKPILRPLSDITEEEKKHIDYPAYQMFRSQVKHPKTLMPAISWAANQTFYLLSKHFDLFNLIPEGLAIDKNSVK